jgi:hypothetical protein
MQSPSSAADGEEETRGRGRRGRLRGKESIIVIRDLMIDRRSRYDLRRYTFPLIIAYKRLIALFIDMPYAGNENVPEMRCYRGN